MRARRAAGQHGVKFVGVVLPHVEAIGAVVIDRTRQLVADIAAGLDVDLVTAIVGDFQVWVELDTARTHGVITIELGQIVVAMAAKLTGQAGPQLALVGNPHPQTRRDQRIGIEHGAQGFYIAGTIASHAMRLQQRLGMVPDLGVHVGDNPLAEAPHKVLLAFNIQTAQPRRAAIGSPVDVDHEEAPD
jgi:hypothetical protein